MQLRDQLQQTLGAGYTVDRELGGGGMSRVFVARDESLQRNVVVKVLPPDLVAGVNVERFNREIVLAAGLQHPHIVPVHSAGQMDGVPFYTMPFVDGESLRARLTRTGALPITEVIGVLRDVAKALAYAHERGVVHRDIKPDNVLMSGGSATVTDFGIAKALSASRMAAPGATLTQIGTSIGTPTYMAPEQAAGDPSTDHRADVYSFGCLAYELLSGRPPFVAKTPQKLLAAHMGETALPITELRPDTPAQLADLVMRCLAKDADERPQQASDIVRVLETVTSGGGHAAMPPILLGGRGMLKKALLAYAIAFVVVAVVAKAAIVAIGLPDWVFPGALVVMGFGLPVILFTAYVHHATRRAVLSTPTFTPGGTPSMMQGTMATIALKASPHMSWRRTAIGGAWAVGAFVLAIGGYMVLRATGVGPFGSLIASGALGKDEKLIVADFPSPSTDSTLGPVVTEAFRTALGQSQSVNVLQQSAMRDVLRRMQKPTTTFVDFKEAREIATREGIRAVVDGNLLGIGGKYVVSLRLMSPQSGDVLATFSANANSASDLLPTIDKLAKEVRAKIGESLRNVQATPPLEQVTTPSLDALKKYVTGARTGEMEGDFAKGTQLLEEAIALDTGFAMAYRKLAVIYGNRGLIDKSMPLLEKAYAHRDRLSDAERYLVVGTYFDQGSHQDYAKTIAAFEQVLDIQPGNTAALNNLAVRLSWAREYRKAKDLMVRAIHSGPVASVHYMNLAESNIYLGLSDSASQAVDDLAKTFPTNPVAVTMRMEVNAARQQYDSNVALVARERTRLSSDKSILAIALLGLADAAKVHGRIADARRYQHEGWASFGADGVKEAAIQEAADRAQTVSWFLGDKAAAIHGLDDSLSRHPIDSIAELNDAMSRLLLAYAFAGRPDQARGTFARWQQAHKRVNFGDDSLYEAFMQGQIALASNKPAEALAFFRAADVAGCRVCILPAMGQSYDLLGNADSTIAVFNRYLETPAPDRGFTDGMFMPGIHKRLGELYEAKGDRQQALTHYMKFADLWKNADPELQPKVAEVRAKIARLSRVEGK
ncbi:MAG TPA: protein kinase [Gemmatimonadaceae bacterium]|nr:protein kinase [Gemmatimonadaceae bacterium]